MIFGAKDVYTILKDQVAGNIKSLYSEQEIDTSLRWLLENTTEISQVDILLNKKIKLSEVQYQHLEQSVQRMNQEEPIQYILGECEFYGRKFIVNPNVLIPRGETEELVQFVIEQHHQSSQLSILDIGTGSGCIAITLAKELPNVKVWALDSSPEAIAIARQNAIELDTSVNFLTTDILSDYPQLTTLDIVVSNPPYVLNSEMRAMRQNVIKYEPSEALFVEDADPLLFYRRISELCIQEFSNVKEVYFEVNEHFAWQVATLMMESGFSSANVKSDIHCRERFVIARRYV
ncbi:MAG: peptide chain release factor N(5)-glutamine methyltransferase [Cyclobacteriaceae bacterium]